MWFPTYYPAALIGTLFLGWQAGVAISLLSAVAANYFFVPPPFSASLSTQVIAGTLTFLLADWLIVLAAAVLRSTLKRLQAAHALEIRLNAELQHRMKNTLAVVQAFVRQTARRYSDPEEFQRALDGRILALSNAHDLLSTGKWELCELPELAQRAVAPFQEKSRIKLEGPSCALEASCCVPLVLALHELATNAFKYGSLSTPEGRVDLTWKISDGSVLLAWAERDGPPVVPPTRRGLGSALLQSNNGLKAVAIRFLPQGLECDLTVQQAGPERGNVLGATPSTASGHLRPAG